MKIKIPYLAIRNGDAKPDKNKKVVGAAVASLGSFAFARKNAADWLGLSECALNIRQFVRSRCAMQSGACEYKEEA